MSPDNVIEVVQQAFEAWARADTDAFLAHVPTTLLPIAPTAAA
jgi:hypothetical protein